MKKNVGKTLSLLLAMVMMLSACGGGTSSSEPTPGGSGAAEQGTTPSAPAASAGNTGAPLTDIVWWETTGTRELETFFMLNTERAADHEVLCNAYSPLLEVNNKGQLQPAVATEWGSDDGGLTWTFKLRSDVTWVDVNGNKKADCTAQDWVTAMEWILNFHKNSGNNTSMPTALIAGAQEYYDYTKDLDAAAAKALTAQSEEFTSLVGVEAPDDATLIYHCTKNAPYFDTLCACACLYPISQTEIEEKGVDGMVGMSNLTMWYNGPYTVTEYIQNNTKTLTRNASYWDKDCSLFNTVTIKMMGDTTMDDQLYQTGEVHQTDLDEATLRSIYNAGSSSEFYDQLVEKRPRKYSYQFHINYAKNNADGTPDVNWNTAAANENFRKSLYYGLDLTNYWARTNFIYPEHCENLAFTMRGLLYFSDGTDYVDRVIEKSGITPISQGGSGRYDAGKAAQYRDKAIEELTAKGVTFPIQLDYYISAGSQTALDTANVLKEIFEGIGDNYIKFNICSFTASQTQEVVNPGLHSVIVSGWGADYGDVENFLGQELYGNDSAYYAMKYARVNQATDPDIIAAYEEFTELAEKASAICDDLDERYEAYAEAEACYLDHALTIPAQYEVNWQLTQFNDYSMMNALYGVQNYTYKNWETSTVPYTTEQYEQIKADFNS